MPEAVSNKAKKYFKWQCDRGDLPQGKPLRELSFLEIQTDNLRYLNR